MVYMTYNKDISDEDRRRTSRKKNDLLTKGKKQVKLKDKAEKTLLSDKREIILLGLTSPDARKPKPSYVCFETDVPHKAFVYEESENVVAHLPKGVYNLCEYYSDVRVYDETGVVAIIENTCPGERMTLFNDKSHVYVRIGKSHNEKLREAKEKYLEGIGVWRA